MSVSRYSPERTPQPTSRPGSPSSERAAKPLAHALDQTLSILMDERVGGYERRFEEMERRLGGFEEIERRFQTQERQLDSLAGRVEQLERDGGSASLDERFAQHLSETERMIKSELKEVEALTDRICRPVLESIGDKAREMERLINEDAAKRQAEMQEMIDELNRRAPESLKQRLRLIEEALAHVLGLDLVAAQQPGEDYTVTVERTLHEFNEELREEEEEERQPTRGDYNAPPRHRGGSSPQRGERTSALRSVSPERGSGRGKPASGIMGQLKELQDRMDEMEDSEKLTQIETLVQQQIKTFESDLEGKASLADLEALEDEAAKRQAEMEEVNELLVALEELMNSRDAESAEQRQHRIESQVRRTIFHMQRRNVANAFNTWVAHTKQVKRQRHLLSTSIGGWRNRMLSRYFRPWAAMCKSPARARRGCLALSSLTTPDAGV